MKSMSVATLGRTRLVGDNTGHPYDDFDSMLTNGALMIDDQQPILKIEVHAGWIVDCMQITYKRSDGSNVTLMHGNKTGGVFSTVDLSASEVVTSVFGRAGYQKYYHCTMINSIGFTIFDQSSCKTRTVGPFGNTDNSNNGECFYAGAVVLFGGYCNSLGLSGLYMYERTAGLHQPLSSLGTVPSSANSQPPAPEIQIPDATSPDGHITAAVMWPNSSEMNGQQVFSKFIVVAKFKASSDTPALMLTLLVNTDIAMPRFKSKGATDDKQSQSLLEVTFYKQDDVTGFARFWGTIGKGELHFTTHKKVVISGPIEGGPSENQTFIGTGTWLMS